MFSRTPAKPATARAGNESVEIGETLSALERARHFGTSKLSLQRLVFVNELVDTAHDIGFDATVSQLLPLVQRLASDPEVLVRQSLVAHFGDLAGFLIQSDPENGYQKVVDDLLPTVALLLSEKAADVRQGAADALATLASHLRPGEITESGQRRKSGLTEVLMTVIELAHSNDDEDARSAAVQLLNSLAEALGQDLCQSFVGIELVALCEDPSFRVRKATASNFAEVARVMGEATALKRLVPAFSKLVHDAHWGVRKAAAESLVPLAMTLSPEKRKECLTSMVNDLLVDSSRWVRMSGLQQLGYFIASLEVADAVPEGMLLQYVEVVQQSKANPDAADISYHCAYTFAAVTKAMGKASWPSLKAPFVSLCTDVQAKTRKAMAASVHIVAQAVGPELTEAEVLPQFEALLQDTQVEVRQAALKNVAGILRAAPGSSSHRAGLKALQNGMGKVDNWRLRQLAALQLGPICAALVEAPDDLEASEQDSAEAARASRSPSKKGKSAAAKDLTWSVVVPLFLQLCGDAVAQVRDAAAKAAAGILRAAAPEMFLNPGTCVQEEGCSGSSSGLQEPLQAGTNHLVRHLIRTFARARSFRNRMTYIRMCDAIIREAPLHIFSELFLRSLIRLGADRVKNVRLLWANTILPHLRKVGRLGSDNLMIAAATRLQQASAKDNPDDEVARLLAGAQLPAVSPEELAALPGPESDLDDSDAGDGPLGTEGGTGDSSECSDVGAALLEQDAEDATEESFMSALSDRAAPPAEQAPSQREDAGALQIEVPEEAPEAPKPASPSGSAASKASPAGKPASPTMGPQVPRSPQAPLTPPGHDAVEDGLVQQLEIEREMDETFSDRRLLAEAEAGNPADLELPEKEAYASEAASGPTGGYQEAASDDSKDHADDLLS
mmetsp:Transcript_47858/g.86330  ORF Transcript_47858/g.86330 Transcript_47858/m.86330 type:complete len:899 (-) Transcript_47858:43-2739(-)